MCDLILGSRACDVAFLQLHSADPIANARLIRISAAKLLYLTHPCSSSHPDYLSIIQGTVETDLTVLIVTSHKPQSLNDQINARGFASH